MHFDQFPTLDQLHGLTQPLVGERNHPSLCAVAGCSTAAQDTLHRIQKHAH